jgi:exodeoxyribonuclease III
MRLVSYNILDGGEGRADPLAEVLIAQRPDIVALIEADNPQVVDRICQRLKMDSITAVGRRNSIALLSRWPIVESVNHALLQDQITACFLEATIRDDSGRDWVLGLVHLHPRAADADDQIRQNEIDCILRIFATRPHLLAGDFNSDSPIQRVDPARCKSATQKAWRDNGGRLPRGAVQKLLDAGYVDTLHATLGDEAGQLASFTTHHPGQRVDYVFAFDLEKQIKSAWIEQDRLAQFASDHFPVGVELGTSGG